MYVIIAITKEKCQFLGELMAHERHNLHLNLNFRQTANSDTTIRWWGDGGWHAFDHDQRFRLIAFETEHIASSSSYARIRCQSIFESIQNPLSSLIFMPKLELFSSNSISSYLREGKKNGMERKNDEPRTRSPGSAHNIHFLFMHRF